jgi:hypothetical protein
MISSALDPVIERSNSGLARRAASETSFLCNSKVETLHEGAHWMK